MKIAFLEGDMSRAGGTERMTAFLANELCNHHDIYLLSLHSGESFFKLADDVKLVQLPAKRQRKAIHRFFRKEQIDIAINVDTGMSIYGVIAAWGTKTKTITWEHSNFYNNWNSRFFPYIRRFAAKFSGALVVLTERDKQNYTDNIDHCAPITVIPNPVATHTHSYPTESKTILSVGHLSSIKRFTLIPEVGRFVFSAHPDWIWRICGDGPEKEQIESKIKEYSLEKNILLTGKIKNIDAEYSHAAIYVLTSEIEGLPMVLLEAKSYGLPIVSFDIMTGPSEIIRDGENGFLVESGNAKALADKLCFLIENPMQRIQFSKNTSLDMDRFDRKAVITKWEQIITSLKKKH